MKDGTIVRITIAPACPGEFSMHGIKPYMDGLEGIVVGFDERVNQHNVQVQLFAPITLEDGRIIQHPRPWFMESELAGPS